MADGSEDLTETCAWCAAECTDELEVDGYPVCSDACRDAQEEAIREDEEGSEGRD